MPKIRDIIKVVYDISQKTLSITDAEFEYLDYVAKEQAEYTHPLKCETQAKYNELGDYNYRLIAALKNLQDVLKTSPQYKG